MNKFKRKPRFWKSLRHSVVFAMFLSQSATSEEIGLKVTQEPMFWIVSQWTRIMIQTPPDCGPLEVACPKQLKLLDRWPHKPGDREQRFYFRAMEPLSEGQITFGSGPYTLAMPIRVMSWQNVLDEKFEFDITNRDSVISTYPVELKEQLPRLFPMNGVDEPKSRLSYLGTEELERQRAEFRKTQADLAAKLMPQVLDLNKLFYSLPESTLPRTAIVNKSVHQKRNPRIKEPAEGCPICGTRVFQGRSAFFPWDLDRENRPFKVHCPECDRWFPSNDFAAGDFTSGEFPDDGWSYFDAKGRPYSFVAYYVLQNYRGGERRVDAYSRAYLASGDKRMARATAVLLFRVAEQYLNLALNINQRAGNIGDATLTGKFITRNPVPNALRWSPYGFYLDGVWSIGPDAFYAEAYERLWDYWAEEDPELIEFLHANHHPEIQTMKDVRTFIETGYFRTVAQGYLDRAVAGNGPTAQAMALRLARFLDTPRSIELVDWVFNNPKNGMRYYMSNNFFKDGSGYESPGYNNAHYGGTVQLADMLTQLTRRRPEQYREANFRLLDEDPRFRAMFDHNISLSLISRTYANTGDDGDLASTDPLPLKPGASLAGRLWASAVERWPDNVNFARGAWDSALGRPIPELTDPALRARVTAVIARESPYLDLPSQVLDGPGHAILRSGKNDAQRALWMRYGTMSGHGHHDSLTIGLEALQRTFLPEQGYYRGESYRTEWDMNWALHYCARIVGASDEPSEEWGRQGRSGGSLQLFGDGGWAKVATAARRFYDEAPAPQLTTRSDDLLQQRTIALVDVDEERSYAVSIFRVAGGSDHYLSFHGPRGTAKSKGLELTAQPGGTLAGADVPYGIKWDSPWSVEHPHLMMFPFLDGVQRARSREPWQVTWELENHPDVHLRLHGLPQETAEVAIAKGRPAGGGKPYELQWVVQHRSGSEPLNSAFVEVIEAYEGDPGISEVRALDVRSATTGNQAQTAVAFEVVCGGLTDTIIHSPDPAATVTTATGITMTGTFGIWSERDSRVQRVFLTNGTQIAKGAKRYTASAPAWGGKIVSVDYPNRKVVASAPSEEAELLVGRYARIKNLEGNDVTHLIVAARPAANGIELTLELDPRIGEGPVKEVYDDGVTSAVKLMFGGLYYKGKTLSNEDNSVGYKINGIKAARSYINGETQPGINKDALSREFIDKDDDGIACFFIYDYGAGDEISIPTIVETQLP